MNVKDQHKRGQCGGWDEPVGVKRTPSHVTVLTTLMSTLKRIYASWKDIKLIAMFSCLVKYKHGALERGFIRYHPHASRFQMICLIPKQLYA